MKTRFRRSWLYVPAIKREWYERLSSYNADVLVLDFEDSVLEPLKEKARRFLLQARDTTQAFREKEFFVRINALETAHFNKDIQTVLQLSPLLDGVVLPKVREISEIIQVDKLLEGTNLEIMPLIEMLEGEHNSYSIIQSSPRIKSIQWSESADYSFDFGLFGDALDAMVHPVATQFAVSVIKNSKINEKSVIDGLEINIRDSEHLRKRCEWAVKMGFDGKMAIHPDQVRIINEVMTPSLELYQQAQEVVRIYEENEGATSIVLHQGSYIHPPLYKSAKRFLEKNKKFFSS